MQKAPHKGPRRGKQTRRSPAAASRPGGWDHVAGWYEGLLADKRSDLHEKVVLPGVVRLLAPRAGERILDIACGEGALCRRLAELGADCTGVDASSRLIQAARKHAAALAAGHRPRFAVGDARALGDVPELAPAGQSFDAAACVLALMNMDPFEPVVHGAAEMLKPGGRLVAVVLHPAFRSPGQTSWGWEGASPPAVRQYRRVDAYLSIASRDIVMNPGQASGGRPAVTTVTWHRPIEVYVHAFTSAGLLIDALEEWPSRRVSQPGPRAAEEDRARREIPVFLALRARKVASGR